VVWGGFYLFKAFWYADLLEAVVALEVGFEVEDGFWLIWVFTLLFGLLFDFWKVAER
jgi:hypothetical protein